VLESLNQSREMPFTVPSPRDVYCTCACRFCFGYSEIDVVSRLPYHFVPPNDASIKIKGLGER
jgi:hypothetical protein